MSFIYRFLYSDEVHIGPETVMTTLYTAKKYAVPALEKHCVDFLKSNLGSDNAFMLLTQASLLIDIRPDLGMSNLRLKIPGYIWPCFLMNQYFLIFVVPVVCR
jgi:hypothetical protein